MLDVLGDFSAVLGFESLPRERLLHDRLEVFDHERHRFAVGRKFGVGDVETITGLLGWISNGDLGRTIIFGAPVIPPFAAPVLEIFGGGLVERLAKRELHAARDDIEALNRVNRFAGITNPIESGEAGGAE